MYILSGMYHINICMHIYHIILYIYALSCSSFLYEDLIFHLVPYLHLKKVLKYFSPFSLAAHEFLSFSSLIAQNCLNLLSILEMFLLGLELYDDSPLSSILLVWFHFFVFILLSFAVLLRSLG